MRVAGGNQTDEPLSEVLPGILHWSGPHPNHGAVVHSHFLTEQRVAVDPIAVDGIVPALERAGGVEQVLLTNRHHLRGSEDLVAAFGASLRCPRPGLHEFETPESPVVIGYGWGEELAPGVTSHVVDAISPDDGALHIAVGPGALAFADAVVADEQGLGFVPDSLMDDPAGTKAGILGSVRGLLELEFDALLLAHGAPVPAGGRRALASFVESPRTARLG